MSITDLLNERRRQTSSLPMYSGYSYTRPTFWQAASKGFSEGFMGDLWRLGGKIDEWVFGKQLPESLIDRLFTTGSHIAPEAIQSAGIGTKFAHGLGALTSDLPAYIAAGRIAAPIVRGSFGTKALLSPISKIGVRGTQSAMTKIGQEMTAMGLTFSIADAMKETVNEGATLGSVVKRGVEGGILGATMGLAGGGVGIMTAQRGRLLRYTSPFAAEVSTLTAVPAIMEGRKPGVDEFVLNTLLLGSIKGVHKGYKLSGEYLRDKMVTEGEAILSEAEIYGEGRYSFTPKMEWLTLKDIQKMYGSDIDVTRIGVEGTGQLADRAWYNLARRIAPDYATVIGVKRGVIEPPPPTRTLYPKAIKHLYEGVQGWMPKGDFRKYYGTKRNKKGDEVPLADDDLSRLSLTELQRIHNNFIDDMVQKEQWVELPEKMRDPYGIVRQFHYFKGGKPVMDANEIQAKLDDLNARYEVRKNNGESERSEGMRALKKEIKPLQDEWKRITTEIPDIITIVPPEELVRMSLIPEARYVPFGARSPRYSLDGTHIPIDVENAYHRSMASINHWAREIEKVVKGEEFNGNNVLALAETEREGKIHVEDLEPEVRKTITNREIQVAELARKIYDSYVTDPQTAYLMGLMTPSGGIRRISQYMTAIHEALKKNDFVIYDRLPGKTKKPWIKKRGKDAIERDDVVKALMSYVYLAEKGIHIDPAIKRAEAKGKMLPELRKKYAIQYVKNAINLRDDLYPDYIDKVSRLIASRVYVGAIGLSPGSMARNFTQLIPTAIEIGPKWLQLGIKQYFSRDPIKRQRIEEAHVQEDYIREYVEKTGVQGKYSRWIDRIDNFAMTFFMTAEKIMRGSTYLGAYEKAMHYKERLNLDGVRQDVVDLIKNHWRNGNYKAAAEAYGREMPLKIHYGYSKIHGAPWLKSAPGRTFFQFWSYPGYTMEMWVESALRGGGKKVGKMILSHPITIAFGHPLGIAMTGFLGWGILPHLSPFTQFLKSLGGVLTADTQRDRDKHLRNLEQVAVMAAPGGRILSSKLLQFVDTARNDWVRINPNTGKAEQETSGMAFLRLMDLMPMAADKDYRLRKRLYEMRTNRNYVRGQAYTKYYQSMLFNSMGQKGRAEKYRQEAIADFLATGGMPTPGQMKAQMRFEAQPQLLESMMRDKKMAYQFLMSLPPTERDALWDMVDSKTINSYTGE